MPSEAPQMLSLGMQVGESKRGPLPTEQKRGVMMERREEVERKTEVSKDVDINRKIAVVYWDIENICPKADLTLETSIETVSRYIKSNHAGTVVMKVFFNKYERCYAKLVKDFAHLPEVTVQQPQLAKEGATISDASDRELSQAMYADLFRSDNYDVAVLISSDRDYLPDVLHIKKEAETRRVEQLKKYPDVGPCLKFVLLHSANISPVYLNNSVWDTRQNYHGLFKQDHRELREQEHRELREQEHRELREQKHRELCEQRHLEFRNQEHLELRKQEHLELREQKSWRPSLPQSTPKTFELPQFFPPYQPTIPESPAKESRLISPCQPTTSMSFPHMPIKHCRFYANGVCNRGVRCKNIHDPSRLRRPPMPTYISSPKPMLMPTPTPMLNRMPNQMFTSEPMMVICINCDQPGHIFMDCVKAGKYRKPKFTQC
jgi:hypothetical protein